jgi:hypothetical protein
MAKCPMCGHQNEVPTYKPDEDDPLAGFDEFLAAYGSQGGSPPPPPPSPRPAAPPTGDELPRIQVTARTATRSRRYAKRTPLQVVTLSCGVAVVALYVLVGLAFIVILLSEPTTNSMEPSEAIVGLLFGPPLIVAGCVLYFGSSIIAYIREHQNAVPIFIVNAVFGWMLIGWIGSLAWAFSSKVRESRQYIRHVIVRESADDGP